MTLHAKMGGKLRWPKILSLPDDRIVMCHQREDLHITRETTDDFEPWKTISLAKPTQEFKSPLHRSGIPDIAICPSSERVAIGHDNGIVIWDVQSDASFFFHSHGQDPVVSVEFLSDQMLAVGIGFYALGGNADNRSRLDLWQLEKDKASLLTHLPIPGASLDVLTLSPKGTHLVGISSSRYQASSQLIRILLEPLALVGFHELPAVFYEELHNMDNQDVIALGRHHIARICWNDDSNYSGYDEPPHWSEHRIRKFEDSLSCCQPCLDGNAILLSNGELCHSMSLETLHKIETENGWTGMTTDSLGKIIAVDGDGVISALDIELYRHLIE
jgi:hypothetical protein